MESMFKNRYKQIQNVLNKTGILEMKVMSEIGLDYWKQED